MKIRIKDNDYQCNLVGSSLRAPKLTDFGISEKDIEEKKKYDKIDSVIEERIENIISIVLSLTIIIFSIVLFFSLILKYSDFSFSFKPELKFYVIGIIIAIVYFGLYIFYILPIVWKITSPIIEKITSPTSDIITKIILKFYTPQKPGNYHLVEAFLKAKSDYDLSIKIYQGIEKIGYDLNIYGSLLISFFFNQITDFINIHNGLIRKYNLRQDQEYWYNLNPYEFEKEVAYWFQQKGYKTKVTPKSGDGGVDIIIRKNDYIGYVQCKRYINAKVDRPTLNALYGVVCANNATQGIIVCLNGITKEATEFAIKTNIKIITIAQLAPEEDLFHHKIKKDELYVNPIKRNDFWCEIGNILLNTNCYRNEEDAIDTIKKWDETVSYHIIPYNNMYFIISCDEDTAKQFQKWISGWRSSSFRIDDKQ